MLGPRRGVATGVLLVLALTATRAAAQVPPPLGGAVVDLRFVSATVPSGPGWTPPLATGVVPGRGFGVELGTHAFLGPGVRRRLFVGASASVAQGRASDEQAPTVTTRLRTAAPHLGMGFGHGDGWSYVSVGAGMASVRSQADTEDSSDAPWAVAIHYGGGARWFVRPRVALTLDLRFWALTPRAATPTRVSGAATTRIALGAGLAIR